MKYVAIIMLLLTYEAQAGFLFHYGLNYSTEKDDTSGGDYEKKKVFHKLFLGASVNQRKTLYFGWNINSWNSSLKKGTPPEETYSLLEMGPKVTWFLNEESNWYLSAEWNPYAKGDRKKAGVEREISGSSMGVGFGYRFRISRLMGLGASIHYHSLSVGEEKISSTERDVSDKVTGFMPMLEFSIITR